MRLITEHYDNLNYLTEEKDGKKYTFIGENHLICAE